MRGEIFEAEQEEPKAQRQEDTKHWDVFRNKPTKTYSGSAESKFIDIGTKVLKVFTLIITFSVVLISAIISKGTLLFMTSQIKKDTTRLYCNKNIDENKQFMVVLPEEERVVWIWLVIFTFMVPELCTFIRSVRIMYFKGWKLPTLWDFFWHFIAESLATLGSAFLVFIVLPELDVIKGAMLSNAVCFVPGLVTLFSRTLHSINSRKKMVLDIIAILGQTTAFVVWPVVDGRPALYFIPASLLFISFGWWENFVSETSPLRFIKNLAKGRMDVDNKIYFTYSVLAPWKCLLFFITTVVIIVIREGDAQFLFRLFSEGFRSHNIEILPELNTEYTATNGYSIIEETSPWTPLSVWFINISATYVCYAFGKFACKIMIQKFGFAFPINLSMPLLLTALVALCEKYNQDVCAFQDVIPPYLFFTTPSLTSLNYLIINQYLWIWLIWVLSQIWITKHIWINNNEKLAATEKLFMKPMYDAFLIDQSVALNRRKIKKSIRNTNDVTDSLEINEDKITQIYGCGTMWHESKEEMIEFLKSILRMDEDQCAHRIVRNYLQCNLSSYYEFETHIFFDDAFIRTSEDDQDPHVNEYVLDLIESVSTAAGQVHRTNVRIRPPVVYSTPYGGRLVWILPGKTKMIAHLKDKAKIRSKKRWSQVMYMYYLLGHGIMENDKFTADIVSVKSENTYILALDGDIDFQPHAVHLLVDLMKKSKTIGAACGRIHPVGSGVMAWNQTFEYALAHWLWKATEHVIGCVLCSPGCFSLLRAKALMDDNVIAKFAMISEKAQHCIQCDQGEDRWLCTLLLQRGYSVQYCAASDAYTHCPEGFSDFYIQRRRWIPSNTANNIDLVVNYQHMVKNNKNISRLYILYQVVLLIGTTIAPGIIFLMLVASFVVTFKLDHWSSFACNVVPILLFVLVCATCKSDTQLRLAGVISGLYGIIMMVILITMIIQLQDNGWFTPSSLFVLCIAFEFILTALLHPQEIQCLKYIVIYYITIPSMYILLIIYSLFNMNNISWGTREVTVVPKPQTQNGVKKEEKPESKKNKVYSFFGNSNNAGSLECSCGDLFKVICCTYHSDEAENQAQKNVQSTQLQPQEMFDGIECNQLASNTSDDFNVTLSNSVKENSWFYDGELIRSNVSYLDKKEENFWKALLEKYLRPTDDIRKKDKIEKELKNLKDKMVIIFFTVNSLFVMIVYILVLQKYELDLSWLINSTCYTIQNEECTEKDYLHVEVISFILFICFAVFMVMQFLAMLYHRFGTYSHIMANTTIDLNLFKTNKNENVLKDQISEKGHITILKKIIKQEIIDGDDRTEGPATPRNTIHALALEKESNAKPVIEDLELAFTAHMKKLRNSTDKSLPVPSETLEAIRQRMETVQKNMTQKSPNSGHRGGITFDNLAYEEETIS